MAYLYLCQPCVERDHGRCLGVSKCAAGQFGGSKCVCACHGDPLFEHRGKTLMEVLLSVKPVQFNPGVVIDVKNKRVTIILENVPYYGEWLHSEDGDIAIYRAMDNHRVVGAFLPLRVWNGNFPVSIINE